MPDAEHAETAPGASRLVISKLVCSLAGKQETVNLAPGTLAARIYGTEQACEQFACNYGVNPDYTRKIFQGDLKASGFGPDGEVRILELESRPFYLATLFLPQSSSTPEHPHPLILAYLKAAAG